MVVSFGDMGKNQKLFISKFALRFALVVTAVSFGYLVTGAPDDSNAVYVVRVGFLLSVAIASYRRFMRETNGRPLSTIEAHFKPIVVYSLTTTSLILVLLFALPSLSQTQNPEYDALKGPVLVEECAYDYAQGEICGEKDLNPEFIQRGENLRLFVLAIIAGTYFLCFTKIGKWQKRRAIEEVNGHELVYEAKLSNIDLSNQNLTRAYLVGAELNRANLSNTKLVRASLFRANLEDANLKDANLRGADLRDANLRGADLTGASLFEADLTNATMPNGTIHE